jgi:hypothetical protein
MDGMMSVLFGLQNIEFDTACNTTCAKYDNLAMNTKAEVENILDRTDTSDLRASFRRALFFSIPPLTLYHNFRPGAYSNLTFGVPLVDHERNEDNVPKIMRMCIDEVEKRGLNTNKIYSVSRLRYQYMLGFMLSVAVRLRR